MNEPPPKKQKREKTVDGSLSSADNEVTVDTKRVPWSLGFEWDLNGFNVYADEKKKTAPPPKLVIAELPEYGVRAENDSGHVEFVSEPLNSDGYILSEATVDKPSADPEKALKVQIGGILKLLKSLKNGSHKITCKQREKGYDEIKSVFLERGKTVTGRPQATVGIPITRIPELLKSEWVNAKGNVNEVLKLFDDVDKYPDALGFLSLVNYYYYTLKNVTTKDKDGPKQNFEALARNSFRGLYLALDDRDRKYVDEALAAHWNEQSFNERLLPKGYRTDAGPILNDLSIYYSEWIHSILDPEAGRTRFLKRLGKIEGFEGDLVKESLVGKKMDTDLLSPPPFFDPAPEDGIPYSMGRYGGVKGGLALFELRAITEENLSLIRVGKLIKSIIAFLSQMK